MAPVDPLERAFNTAVARGRTIAALKFELENLQAEHKSTLREIERSKAAMLPSLKVVYSMCEFDVARDVVDMASSTWYRKLRTVIGRVLRREMAVPPMTLDKLSHEYKKATALIRHRQKLYRAIQATEAKLSKAEESWQKANKVYEELMDKAPIT